MIVILLGILAGIVTFAVGSFRDGATESACAADARTLATANAAYAAKHGGAGAPSDEVLVEEGFLRSKPSSGIELSNGVVDMSGCGTAPQLALTPEEPPAATLVIEVAATERQNKTKGKVRFSGKGASGVGAVTVSVYATAACSGEPKGAADALPVADGSWGPTASSDSLDDDRKWWASARQGAASSACFEWTMPDFGDA